MAHKLKDSPLVQNFWLSVLLTSKDSLSNSIAVLAAMHWFVPSDMIWGERNTESDTTLKPPKFVADFPFAALVTAKSSKVGANIMLYLTGLKAVFT